MSEKKSYQSWTISDEFWERIQEDIPKTERIKLDNNVNAKVRGEEAIISTADSKVKVVVIPTDEELLIASDTMDILKK